MMQTQCPKCKAIFGVLPKQLRAADGLVRCSQCHTVFNGREQVSFLKPEELDSITRKAPNGTRAVTANQDSEQTSNSDIKPVDELTATTLEEPSSPAKFTKAVDVVPEQGLPNSDAQFALEDIPAVLRSDFKGRDQSRKRGWNSWLATGLVTLLLLTLLGGQYIYFHWWELAHNPQLYASLHKLCELVGCDLPPLRSIEQIELVSRNVYSHPNEANALMITATMENNALFAQPYPLLKISFTNQQDKVIATRGFYPSEYLPQGEDANALMPSGESVNLRLEVVDPGKEAFGYEFDFF